MSKIPTRRISSPFLVGIFVISGIIIVLGGIFWLGASEFLKENIYYVTYFEGSVEGLETGSAVKYLGVPVGNIKNVRVAPDGKLIEIIMQIDRKIEINDNLRVKSEMAGIAGGKFLQLYYPTNKQFADMYPRFTFSPPYTMIKSSPSGIDEIEIAARDVLDNIREFDVKGVSDEAVRFLGSTSNFFENPKLFEIITKLQDASQRLDNILAKADSTDIFTNLSITSRELVLVSNDLKKFTDSLNFQLSGLNLPKTVDRIANSYDSTMFTTKRIISNLGYRADDMLFSVNEILEELKRSNRQFRKTLKAFSDNPAQVFFSDAPPEEK